LRRTFLKCDFDAFTLIAFDLLPSQVSCDIAECRKLQAIVESPPTEEKEATSTEVGRKYLSSINPHDSLRPLRQKIATTAPLVVTDHHSGIQSMPLTLFCVFGFATSMEPGENHIVWRVGFVFFFSPACWLLVGLPSQKPKRHVRESSAGLILKLVVDGDR